MNDLDPRLKFFLYDKEQAWSDSWCDVDDKLNKNISTLFQAFDVTEPSSWNVQSKYLDSDLFTMIYFASEIHRVRDVAAAFFEQLFDRARPGAMFLFVDNASPVFYNWFDKRWKNRGVSVLKFRDSARERLPWDENKSDLGDHFYRLKGYPKLTAHVAYRILRKDE